MDIKLDFNSEEVAQKLLDAMATTAFKKAFEEVVKKELEAFTRSTWNSNSILEKAVRHFLEGQVRDVLNEEYRDKFRAMIIERLTNDTDRLNGILSELIDKIKVSNY